MPITRGVVGLLGSRRYCHTCGIISLDRRTAESAIGHRESFIACGRYTTFNIIHVTNESVFGCDKVHEFLRAEEHGENGTKQDDSLIKLVVFAIKYASDRI